MYVTATVFLMLHVLSQVEAQQCKSEFSIYGAKLKGHIFEEKKTVNFLNCVERCNSNLRCQSVNYVISLYVCEANEGGQTRRLCFGYRSNLRNKAKWQRYDCS